MSKQIPWLRVFVEGVVIVVSILLAFGLQAWWDGVQLRQDERALLTELRTTLGEDLAGVVQAFDTITVVSENLSVAAERFESGDLRSIDREHQDAMASLGRFTQVMIRYGSFETLKARGLGLISNQSLRTSLTSLYEDLLTELQSNTEINQRLSRDHILPFWLDHFEMDEHGNWLLRQGEAEARSIGMTLARYRAQSLVRFYLPSFEQVIELMNQTLAEIENAPPRSKTAVLCESMWSFLALAPWIAFM